MRLCVRGERQNPNLAGGKSWQMSGREYATALYEAMDLNADEACFSGTPSWFDWYDTRGIAGDFEIPENSLSRVHRTTAQSRRGGLCLVKKRSIATLEDRELAARRTCSDCSWAVIFRRLEIKIGPVGHSVALGHKDIKKVLKF